MITGSTEPRLVRAMGLPQATAANMLQMIGIGPFITIPLMLATMGGPQALLGWISGLVLAVCDGMVWAELGAAMPGAGGSYVYLREAYNPGSWGRLMSFLFIWMTVFTAPLSMASGAVGFAQYLQYLWKGMSPTASVAVAMGVCVVVTGLLYRNIESVGRLSVAMLAMVILNMLGIIGAGLLHFDARRVFDFPPGAFHLDLDFFRALGAATLLAIYASGGYQNVCYLAGEVKDAPRTVPRAVILSIAAVSAVYVLMTVGILSVVPWREAMESTAIASDMVGRLYGPGAGAAVTLMILFTAFGSVFALTLGYSRVPYAAAVDGRFFSVFARLHPKERFPHVSLLALGGVSTLLCIFSLEEIIKALIAIQIVVQVLAQIVAVTLIRRYRPDIVRPFEMRLYPLPSVLAFGLWSYILVTSGWRHIIASLVVLVVGAGLFLWRSKVNQEWPFANSGPFGEAR